MSFFSKAWKKVRKSTGKLLGFAGKTVGGFFGMSSLGGKIGNAIGGLIAGSGGSHDHKPNMQMSNPQPPVGLSYPGIANNVTIGQDGTVRMGDKLISLGGFSSPSIGGLLNKEIVKNENFGNGFSSSSVGSQRNVNSGNSNLAPLAIGLGALLLLSD